MIVEAVFNAVVEVIKIALGWINLPPFPLSDQINSLLDLIFSNISGLLGFFVHVTTLKIAVPALLILINFDHIYKLTMWILRKIPFLGVK